MSKLTVGEKVLITWSGELARASEIELTECSSDELTYRLTLRYRELQCDNNSLRERLTVASWRTDSLVPDAELKIKSEAFDRVQKLLNGLRLDHARQVLQSTIKEQALLVENQALRDTVRAMAKLII